MIYEQLISVLFSFFRIEQDSSYSKHVLIFHAYVRHKEYVEYQNFYFLVAVVKFEVCIDCNPIANQGREHATKKHHIFNLFDLK